MRRVLMVAATLALPAGLFVALNGGQAFAKAPKPPKLNGKVECTGINGNASSTVTLSGCIDSGSAVTGTSSKPINAASLETGGTVTWINNNTSQFAAPVLATTSNKKCPGYTKPPKGGPTPSGEPAAEKFSGSVTADTSGLKIPGRYKGAVCIASDGTITALKPLKAS